MKRQLLLESLASRWCPSGSHVHEDPTPPVVVEPPPIVVVPEPTPPPVVVVPEPPGEEQEPSVEAPPNNETPPVVEEPNAPPVSTEPPPLVSGPPLVPTIPHEADHQDEFHSSADIKTREAATIGDVSIEGAAMHQGHELAAMSWSAWPTSGTIHHTHESLLASEHHADEPEHVTHGQSHSSARHSAEHLFVPVFMDMPPTDASEAEATHHDDGNASTPNHEPTRSHAKPVDHHSPNVLLEELSPITPTLDAATPSTATIPVLELTSFESAIKPIADHTPTVRFHFDLTEPQPSEQRLFGWCSLSLFLLWCGWKMQPSTTKHRPRQQLAG